MITTFGKEVRKLRIDQAMTLKNMANGLGVTSAYLSSVETGKKNITAGLVEKIASLLGLSNKEQSGLQEAANQTKIESSLKASGIDEDATETVAMFARRFSKLTPEEIGKIKRIIENR